MIYKNCKACGHVHARKSEWVREAILFKSGARKGRVKEVKEREVVLEIGEPFKTSKIISHIGWLGSGDIEYEYFTVCPECGTVQINGE